jgi:hypothetical protein
MFKVAIAGLLIAILLSTQVVAGTARIGSQSTGAGAGKVTFNPFSVTRKTATPGITGTGNSFAGAGRTVPWTSGTPKTPVPPLIRHLTTIGGTTGGMLAPHCVAPNVAVAYCVRRGPGAHGKCQEIMWRCQVPGVANSDPDRQ